MKSYILFLIVFVSFAVNTFAADVLFDTSFTDTKLSDGWVVDQRDGTLVGVSDGALRVSVPDGSSHKFASASLPLPVESYRGCRLLVRSRVRCENIAKPPNAWNGVKCMLKIVTPSQTHWLQQNDVNGTFDWRDIAFNANVPRDTQSLDLILGIENTTGTVLFQNVRIEAVARQRSRTDAAQRVDNAASNTAPRIRGAMISPQRFAESDLDLLAGKWKANHVRWQIIAGGFPRCVLDDKPVAEYNEWFEGELVRLEKMMPLLEKYGVKVVIDVHTPPGGRDETSDCLLFKRKEYQEAFIANWIKIAKRFRGKPAVWGYDLVNEPVEGIIPDGVMNWRDLALVTAKAIRQIDRDTPIIIEPAPWASPDALDWFEPFDKSEVDNVIYSVHYYLPHSFTHQGVHNKPNGIKYPGKIDGKDWNKEQIRQTLRPIIEFQKDYGVTMYIGEFSAARWADGAATWLNDVIELLEENQWHWAYHAFRESDIWSIEHDNNPKNKQRSNVPTDREMLLRKWWELNAK
ncbi:MAG: glycoside hydrolase family 5 protein [Planctomycetaceae bacterium]|jgi:hypothetical protein|nr:glycoside hydrolase family 5 protein [Planctomycetaceae bacterium]